MTNAIEQAEHIILGQDQGQNPCDMYDRIALPASEAILNRALQVRQFFQAGWFRLWRKDVLNRKVCSRDTTAFAELKYIEGYVHERQSMMAKRKTKQ